MLKRSPVAVFLAVALHLLIVFFLIFGMEWELFPQQEKPPVEVVQAHAVDMEKLRRVEAEEKAKVREKKEQQAKKQKQAEEKKRLAALEKKRKADAEAKRKADAKQKAVAEDKRKAEVKRKAEAKRKAEEKRKADAIAKKKAEEKRKAEAEAKRKAEAKRQAELAAKREAAARAERERALQDQLAAEQNARETDRYVAVIRQQIERKWLRPAQTGEQLSCVVQVRLIPGGDVVPGGVSIVKSSGNAAFDRSVEAAVYKAAPLQVPSGGLFESFRNLRLNFKPSK
ncbi:MAG: cell envelope integrity protein TolA [Candidatus Thiodiazotropha sp. (ex Myrtea sp. 'scaly one' KF741663)]|nr:cell envelope integrity protein TolA [Candidatus Thiodiazotropha sp. (ex Myrtea sp. 'scaly one' KF741663)]